MPQLVQLFHIVLISDDSNNFDFNIRQNQMTRKYCLMAQNYHQMTQNYHQMTQIYHQLTQNYHQMTQTLLQREKKNDIIISNCRNLAGDEINAN